VDYNILKFSRSSSNNCVESCFIAPEFATIWADLAACFESYLFPVSKLPNVSSDELQADEECDVSLVEIMRNAILPHAGELPKVFVLQIVSILNRGSIHSATSASPVGTYHNQRIRSKRMRRIELQI
jgi:hypothetical protein